MKPTNQKPNSLLLTAATAGLLAQSAAAVPVTYNEPFPDVLSNSAGTPTPFLITDYNKVVARVESGTPDIDDYFKFSGFTPSGSVLLQLTYNYPFSSPFDFVVSDSSNNILWQQNLTAASVSATVSTSVTAPLDGMLLFHAHLGTSAIERGANYSLSLTPSAAASVPEGGSLAVPAIMALAAMLEVHRRRTAK